MGKASPAISNFNAGEFSPLLEGRTDFERYANGCTVMENFIPTVQGPAIRRAGTRFVAPVKNAESRVWLQPFEVSEGTAYVLEFGNLYIRFYANGGQLVSGGSPVEVVTPYSLADLFDADNICRLRFAQSGDILYITHPNHAPRVLKRTGATTFELATFSPIGGPFEDINPDSSVSVHASGETGTITLYASDAIFTSSHVGVNFLLETPDDTNILAWEAGKKIAGVGESVYGLLRKSDSKVYRCVTEYTVASGGVEARTGSIKPVHTRGIRPDGDGNAVTSGSTTFAARAGFDWEFLHAGYGWAQITAVAGDGKSATAQVLARIPSECVLGTAGASYTVSAVTFTVIKYGQQPTGNEIFPYVSYAAEYRMDVTVTAHPFNTGDSVTVSLNGAAFVRTGRASKTGANSFSIKFETAPDFVLPTFSSGTAVSNANKGVPSRRWAFGAWSAALGWPSSVTFFRERLCFTRGQKLWMSVASAFDDFSSRNDSGEVSDDQAITLEIASGEINDVHWLHAARELVAGTAGGEFVIGELQNGDPIGPGNIRVQAISRFGTRSVQPVGSGSATLFLLRSGAKLRELSYDFTADSYDSKDVTTLSDHITSGGITDMDFALEPYSVLWAVRKDGALLGFTWNNEEQVKGWHRHTLGGAVESVAVIPRPDGLGDQVWLCVRRTINGATTRYIEWMENPTLYGGSQIDAHYVDCGLTYDGAATTTLNGLDHLEGCTVDVLINGYPHPQRVVSSGAILLQAEATTAHVGLPYISKLQTMRIEAGAQDGTSQGKTKRIHKIVFRLLDTAGVKVGPDENNLQQLEFRVPADAMDSAPPLFSGDKVVSWPGGYDTDGRVMVYHDQPTPLTLVAIYPQVMTQDSR